MEKEIFVKLPCNIGSTVYTISRDDCPCDICNHGEKTNYSALNCYNMEKDYKCPPPVFSIEEHVCEGFTIGGDTQGNPIISKPGEWGYEGLETFHGCDDKVYYTYEDAEKSLIELNNNKQHNEHERRYKICP